MFDSVEELTEKMADDFTKKVNAAIDASGECNLVLYGGN